MAYIEFQDVKKIYKTGDVEVHALDGTDFSIEKGELCVILGQSGAGKTTLLNIIAGLTDFSGEKEGVTNVSMVFQKDRLVPHLAVEENIRLVNKSADISALLREVGLEDSAKLYPKDLSAGMARRVAIIRAFAYDAPVVLMDEPLINLDLALKYSLIERIKELREKFEKTVVLVTHDVKEAVMLADKVIVLNNGKTVFEATNTSEEELTGILLNLPNGQVSG